MSSSNRSAKVWAGVAGAMVIMVLAASTGSVRLWTNPEVETTEQAPSERTPTPTPDVTPVAEEDDGFPGASTALEVIGWIVLVTFLAAAVYAARNLFWWVPIQRLYRRILPASWMPDPLPEATEVVLDVDIDAALAALADGEPRNAIVACWMRLEEDAAAMGFARMEAETSSEYVERVVTAASVDPGPITGLADLYREARFSVHELDDRHRGAAVDALHGVVAALRTSVGVSG